MKDCVSPAAGELYKECTFAVTLQAVIQGISLMTCEAGISLSPHPPTPPPPPHTGLLAKTLDAEAAIPWNSLLSSRSYLIVKC